MRTRRYLLAVVCMLFMASAVWGAEALVDRSAYEGNALKTPWGEVGFRFMTGANPQVVNGLGFIDLNNDTPLDGPDGDGLKSAVTVTLWQEGDSSIVAQTVVPAGEGGELYDGFRYGSVPSTTLIPNTNYVLSFNSGAILDNYLDANVAVTLNPMYVGTQASTTWEIRWTGTVGAMPATTATWGVERTYGCVNMRPAPVGPKAVNPSPTSMQPNVPRSTGLSWTPADDPIVFAQAVYFSASPTDPNIYEETPIIKTGDETLSSVLNAELPFALEYGAEYRWRVDTSVYENDPNTFAGAEWKFFTVPASPLIVTQPADVVVASGTDAVFTVEAYNPQTDDSTGMTYQWYKVDAGGDIELADDADYSGVTTVTLTVSAPTFADDDGDYYCAVSNGAVTNTDNAHLTVKARVVWINFDNNTIDFGEEPEYSGTPFDTSGANPSPVLSYTEGVDGVASHALVLGDDPNIVKLANTDGAGAFDFYPQGLTVSVWVKTTQAAWGGIVAKQYRVTGEDRLGWVLDTSPTGIPTFQILQATVYASTSTAINDGEWHLLTATYNAQEPAGRLYLDGLLVGTDTTVTTPIPTEEEPVILGAHNVAGDFRFEGAVDDLQIWNHAQTSLEVASIYYDMLPGAENICLDGITPDGDINGDCRVDLLDWAEVAGSWLECNVVRSCLELPTTIP